MVLFIVKFSIAFPGPDAEDPDRRKTAMYIVEYLHNVSKMWYAHFYSDFSVTQPEGFCELNNAYLRTDYVYLYQNLNHTRSILYISQACEALAKLLATLLDAEIKITYPDDLPPLCPEP
jgi:hypothetical protein